jgi:hypothetical protein
MHRDRWIMDDIEKQLKALNWIMHINTKNQYEILEKIKELKSKLKYD